MSAPPLLTWDAPGPYAVAFSTRRGGVSEGPFASLNLGRLTDDAPEHVEENRRRLCATLDADAGRLALNRQRHSATVNRAEAGVKGEPGDGIWTDEPGVPMVAMTADCVPVALARANGGPPALALLHTGWRGLLEGIVPAGAEALGRGRLAAAVGPAIGPCCYEVGEEVAEPFRARFGAGVVRAGRLDLWTSAERALRAAGVEEIERLDLCTACNPDLFFSHRRDAGLTGRQGVIGLVT
ncbi:MAG: purine-nucleoside/S-methyl-5-thioadenosine phosphorylase / adenosine deaminase [Gaiellaceae bacterium]|nr:purine-nucleoside/S-methyl-5-thioadenosine phosphorylase / adenosine deaminase [Gaiellaceae bacterium]